MKQPILFAIVFVMVGLMTAIFTGHASFNPGLIDVFSSKPLVEQKLYLKVRGKNLVGLKHLLYVSPEYANRKVESILVKATNLGRWPSRFRIGVNQKVRMVASLPSVRRSSDLWFRMKENAIAFNEIEDLNLLTHGDILIESISLQFAKN